MTGSMDMFQLFYYTIWMKLYMLQGKSSLFIPHPSAVNRITLECLRAESLDMTARMVPLFCSTIRMKLCIEGTILCSSHIL